MNGGNTCTAGGVGHHDRGGFSPLLWHVLVAALLVVLITAGCSSGNSGSSAGPMGPVAVPKPAAAEPSALSPLARTTNAVRDAFAKDYPDGATVTKVHHRLMPDGFVHYTLTSTDGNGVQHTDEYRADGIKVTVAK